jgi:HPr kinase/phosphorylase
MLQVEVARLHDDNREALSLGWVAGRGSTAVVRREAAASASLIGHLNLTHPNSIQVIGSFEAGTVAGFVERLFGAAPSAVVFADGVAPPPAAPAAQKEEKKEPEPERPPGSLESTTPRQ